MASADPAGASGAEESRKTKRKKEALGEDARVGLVLHANSGRAPAHGVGHARANVRLLALSSGHCCCHACQAAVRLEKFAIAMSARDFVHLSKFHDWWTNQTILVVNSTGTRSLSSRDCAWWPQTHDCGLGRYNTLLRTAPLCLLRRSPWTSLGASRNNGIFLDTIRNVLPTITNAFGIGSPCNRLVKVKAGAQGGEVISCPIVRVAASS